MFSFMVRDEWKSENALVFVEAHNRVEIELAQRKRFSISARKRKLFHEQVDIARTFFFCFLSVMAIISRVGLNFLQMKFRNETFISSNGKLKAHTPLSLCIEFPPCRLQRDSFPFSSFSTSASFVYWQKLPPQHILIEKMSFYEWICFSQSTFLNFDSSRALKINCRMIWSQRTLRNIRKHVSLFAVHKFVLVEIKFNMPLCLWFSQP